MKEKKSYSDNFAVCRASPGHEARLLKGAEAVLPDYTVDKDGVAFSLPANQIEIVRTSKGRQVSKGKKVAATRSNSQVPGPDI